jgi:type IV pilus assembly protein PilM
MAKTKLGFDIGNNSLKIAVEKGGEIALHEVRLPEHLVENGEIAMPHAFSDFLKKTARELRLPRGAGALLIPAGQVICRQVTMPRMTQRQLMMNLPYEFSDFIQGEPEQYFCDYAVCDPVEEQEEGQLTLMAAAVAKKQSHDYIRMFARAGITLKILLPQEMALIQIVRSYRERNPQAQKEFCFVDLGHASTRIIVINGDRLQAVRQVPVGGQDLDHVIADHMNIDTFLADSYKRDNYRDIVAQPSCMELYGRIAVEILKVINFYRFTFREHQLEGIYLIGGGANIPPLCQSIGGALEMPLYPAEDLIPGGKQNKDLCAVGVLAAGMALAKEDR